MTINPNNYTGANLTLVGTAGGDPQRKDFDGGGSVTELRIAVSQGYKKDGEWVDAKTPTAWYTLSASADYASDNWPHVGKGDKVRIDDARQELREFTRRDGTSGLEVVLKYGTLTVVESKSATEDDGQPPF